MSDNHCIYCDAINCQKDHELEFIIASTNSYDDNTLINQINNNETNYDEPNNEQYDDVHAQNDVLAELLEETCPYCDNSNCTIDHLAEFEQQQIMDEETDMFEHDESSSSNFDNVVEQSNQFDESNIVEIMNLLEMESIAKYKTFEEALDYLRITKEEFINEACNHNHYFRMMTRKSEIPINELIKMIYLIKEKKENIIFNNLVMSFIKDNRIYITSDMCPTNNETRLIIYSTSTKNWYVGLFDNKKFKMDHIEIINDYNILFI